MFDIHNYTIRHNDKRPIPQGNIAKAKVMKRRRTASLKSIFFATRNLVGELNKSKCAYFCKDLSEYLDKSR